MGLDEWNTWFKSQVQDSNRSQVVRASDSDRKAGFDARCHYPRVHTEYVLVCGSVPGEYFPPLQFTCRNCGGGDRGRVAIYRLFGEFLKAK
ncbi:hypothetical protein TNCV_1581981 [Trichonephila clavipes]|nr:hypothetical protein TNCV_1581981 [Trichonephila clavipes]